MRLLKFRQAKTHLTGQLLQQSLEATKLEIGCPGQLFALTFSEYGILATSMWITHIWQFLSSNKMEICERMEALKLQREQDQFLIAGFRSHRNRR
jgi:hypothetical protein